MRFRFFLLVAVSSALAAAPPPPSKKDLPASVVTLKNQLLTLTDALAELKKQTGNTVVDLRPRFGQTQTNPVLHLHLNKVPFWWALDVIAEMANVSVYPYAGESAIGIVNRRQLKDYPVCYSGPFRIVLKRLTSELDLVEDAAKTTATLELTWEPRYYPLFLKPDSAQPGKGDIKLLGLQAVEVPVRLPAKTPSKDLKGTFTVWTSPGLANFEFKKPAPGATETRQDLTVKLNRFAVEANVLIVGLTLDYPRHTLDLESHHGWLVQNNEMYWVINGERHKPSGYPETSVVDGGPIHVTYRFNNVPGKPQAGTLIYRAPAPPVACQVPFHFKDLPLP